jgi:phosphinothricin acetyltransferase
VVRVDRSDAHRKGVDLGLCECLLSLLKPEGFHRAFAGITLPNPGSVGLHESIGFEPLDIYRDAGYKFGDWHDVGWWQFSLREKREPSGPPRYLPQVVQPVEWEMAMNEGLAVMRL